MGAFLARTALCWSLLAAAVCVVSADEGLQYREFRLGSTLADVTAIGRTSPTDLVMIHERPALLQQLTWRPRYMTGRPMPDLDSIRDVIFSFVDDQLFRIAVEYDERRTAGLTGDDMVVLLAPMYGTPSSVSKPAATHSTESGGTSDVAKWRRDDSEALLQHTEYTDRFVLVITSIPLERAAARA